MREVSVPCTDESKSFRMHLVKAPTGRLRVLDCADTFIGSYERTREIVGRVYGAFQDENNYSLI